jgi:hypothetical protein
MLNNIFNQKEKFNIYFNFLLKAIDYYGKSNYLIKIDKKGSFIKKIQEYKKYKPDDLPYENEQALKYLFHELFYLKGIPK